MTRPFRILHLIDHLGLGGAQRALLDFIQAADATRFVHEVACLHGRGVEWGAFTAAGVVTHSLSLARWNPVFLVRLARLLRRGNYDAIHCHLFYSNAIGKPIAAALGMRQRFAHDQWNDPPPTDCAWMRIVDRLAHRFSTQVFAVSPFIGVFLTQTQGLPAGRVTVVPNGTDLQRFPHGRESSAEARRRWGLPASGPILGAVARLAAQKNLGVFLRAAAQVAARHPEAIFLLAGTGEEEAALKREAARLGLGERCRFLGHVADMPQLYPALDVMVLPSIFEGFGLVIVEALLCGAAVVASEVAGARDYLRDGEDCFFARPDDVETFARHMLALVEDPALRERQTRSARAVIERELSSTAMARRIEAVYLRHLEPGS